MNPYRLFCGIGVLLAVANWAVNAPALIEMPRVEEISVLSFLLLIHRGHRARSVLGPASKVCQGA